MAHTSYTLEITSSEGPTVPLDFCFSDCFSINLDCSIEWIPPTNPTAEIDFSSSATFNEAFLVPSDILCNCTPLTDFNRENTQFLHQIFSIVPISPQLLDQILPHLAETARTILSHERCGLLEMDINLHAVTRIADEDDDHQNVSEVDQLVNLLERVKVDEEDDGVEQCSICLEEFGHGIDEDSSGEAVRTNCNHVFHERCIFRWLERCVECESPYSCPLCRCNMFPISEEDE